MTKSQGCKIQTLQLKTSTNAIQVCNTCRKITETFLHDFKGICNSLALLLRRQYDFPFGINIVQFSFFFFFFWIFTQLFFSIFLTLDGEIDHSHTNLSIKKKLCYFKENCIETGIVHIV